MIQSISIAEFKSIKSLELNIQENYILDNLNNRNSRDVFQALVLWDKSVRAWSIRNPNRWIKLGRHTFRPGLLTDDALPITNPKELWFNQLPKKQVGGNPQILVRGYATEEWECGFLYRSRGDIVFYCYLIEPEQSKYIGSALNERVVIIPPTGGVPPTEPYLDDARVNYLLRWGATGDIIRNLCYRLYSSMGDREREDGWERVTSLIESIFQIELMPPVKVAEHGEVRLSYKENKRVYDISVADRAVHQALIVLTLMHLHPSSTWLLDEPFVYLEPDQQKRLYKIIVDSAEKLKSHILIKSNCVNIYDRIFYNFNNIQCQRLH